MDIPMGRGQKRSESGDELPADKRSCSSLELRPSSSNSSVQTQLDSPKSATETLDTDMDTSSAAAASGEEEEDKNVRYESDDDSEEEEQVPHSQSHSILDDYQRQRSSGYSGQLSGLLTNLNVEGEPSGLLAALTELCEVLSFCSEGSFPGPVADSLSSVLVKLATHEENPDVILLSIRAITYLCDAYPRSSRLLLRHGAIPALCQRLLAIEYLDVAEQCLQALEKISREQPLACLQAGAVMAVLSFLDFFSTSIQRVALSTVVNICTGLRHEDPTNLIGAVPILCNLLNYEDQKLVESAALCLTKAGEWMSQSSDMLDELCKNGLIDDVARFVNLNRTTLSQPTYNGLIGLLAKLSSGSSVAFKRLYELDTSSTLKDILSTYDLTHGLSSPHLVDRNCNQVDEILKLLNEMLPSSVIDQGDQRMSEKESFLVSHPDLLKKLGIGILPILIQVVNSGANVYISYGCLSVVSKLVRLSTSDMLAELLNSADISSFLAGIFTRKDYHILMLALQIVEMILQKLSDVYLNSFMKEGVFFAVDALTTEKCSQSMSLMNGGTPFPFDPSKRYSRSNVPKCLCYAFDARQLLSASESGDCKIEKDSVCNLAKHMQTNYFAPELLDSGRGVTDVLRNLRDLSGALSDLIKPGNGDATTKNEEKFYSMLHQVMAKICGEEPVSTFELIESGVLKSLVNYLSNGLCLGDNLELNGVNSHFCVLGRRFEVFARFLLSSTDFLIDGRPLSMIIHRLQSALSSLENFPAILSQAFKLRKSYAAVPSGRSTEYPCLRVRFVREEGEACLCDYSEGTQSVDPFCSLDAIEDFLWPKVSAKRKEVAETEDLPVEQMDYQSLPLQENAKSSLEGSSGLALSDSFSPDSPEGQDFVVKEPQCPLQPHVDVGSQSSSICAENVSPGLVLYLEGHKLDRTLTFYQAILQQQIRSGNEMIVGAELFSRTYTITYSHDAERQLCDSIRNTCTGQSSSIPDEIDSSVPNAAFLSRIFPCKLPSDVDNSSPINDILFLLRCLEGMNRYSLHLNSCERLCAFSEGRLDSLDNLKISIHSVPRNEFVSSKLTEKLEQQMRDPSAVHTGGLPLWCNELMSSCPFLFGFQTRCKYFHLAAFGQRKAQPRLDSGTSTDRQLSPGSLPRKKFLVSRDQILESATVMMGLHAREKVLLEVVYNEEVGTGLGPTLEFYTLVSHEFQKPGLGMWRDDHSAPPMMKHSCVENSGILITPFGLFPRPWSPTSDVCDGIEFVEVSKKFMLLGQIVAKAIQNGRMLDLPFSKAFYKLILGQELSLYDIQSFDPELYKTLLEFEALVRRKSFLKSVLGETSTCQLESCFRNTRIEDLCLDFSLPGYPDYILSGNDHKTVNEANLEEYVKRVVNATVKSGISRQVEAFKSGFNQVFPIEHLQIFIEEELELLLCGEHESWTLNELLDHIKFDHGYTASSPPIINLLEIIKEFNHEERRAFLQFVTGAPRLPPGGLASLHPKLTIVRKQSDNLVDADLPSVMTCANYLKLPPYPSKERMKEKLTYAITEGQGSFHLS